MRLMTLNYVPGQTAPHTITVDQETGKAGKSVYTVKIDGRPKSHFITAKKAIEEALIRMFTP